MVFSENHQKSTGIRKHTSLVLRKNYFEHFTSNHATLYLKETFSSGFKDLLTSSARRYCPWSLTNLAASVNWELCRSALGLFLAYRNTSVQFFSSHHALLPSKNLLASRISKYIHTWFLAVPPIHNLWTMLWDYPYSKGHAVCGTQRTNSKSVWEKKKLKTPTTNELP